MNREPAAGISVIMVVKNGQKYLKEAIESVLGQTRPPEEIILVDGQSADQTAEIAQSYPQIRYLKQEKNGLADARNLGIRSSTRELITFLDHDDTWPTDKLQRQLREFQRSPQLEYCYGQVRFFPHSSYQQYYGFELSEVNGVMTGRTPGTLMARREMFETIGMFDPRYSIACDFDWFARAAGSGLHSLFLPEVLLHKRLHESNLSGNREQNRIEIMSVLRYSLQRKTGSF
jgi:glycosyltransferase involved in cell wall biosynthesis